MIMMTIGVASIGYNRIQGIERASAEIADRLAAWGHQVHYHCSTWSDVGKSGVHFHKVPTLRAPNALRIATFAAIASRKMKAAGYAVAPDISANSLLSNHLVPD